MKTGISQITPPIYYVRHVAGVLYNPSIHPVCMAHSLAYGAFCFIKPAGLSTDNTQTTLAKTTFRIIN